MKDITPQEIVAAILLPTTTMAEAASLVESYARAYASGEVIKAIERQHARNMAILEAPLVTTLKDICEKCGSPAAPADDFEEILCDDCVQNRAEAAWERHCEDFHDGGSTRFKSLAEQQADARRLK